VVEQDDYAMGKMISAKMDAKQKAEEHANTELHQDSRSIKAILNEHENDVDMNVEEYDAADFKIPRIHTHLVKRIPSQAGMGGGSADAAYMIRLLDERFRLNIGIPEMERYAAKLGADCAYFISADPENGDTACYAEGIGDVLMPVSGPGDNMKGYYIVVVKRDDIAVSTKDAYAAITPKKPAKCCRDIVRQPIETWKDELVNDFEAPIFAMHPELAEIKQKLYNLGAAYAAMSGSGSAIFGIFKHKPANIEEQFEGMFCKVLKL
jgi:4-diphosphocytidyl-2-C-methyl-D-erythritol kinase